MKIEILGMGCVKCNSLEANVKEALKQTNINAQIEKVSDLNKIMSYNVMSTPALVINGEVKAIGKVLSVEEIVNLLK